MIYDSILSEGRPYDLGLPYVYNVTTWQLWNSSVVGDFHNPPCDWISSGGLQDDRGKRAVAFMIDIEDRPLYQPIWPAGLDEYASVPAEQHTFARIIDAVRAGATPEQEVWLYGCLRTDYFQKAAADPNGLTAFERESHLRSYRDLWVLLGRLDRWTMPLYVSSDGNLEGSEWKPGLERRLSVLSDVCKDGLRGLRGVAVLSPTVYHTDPAKYQYMDAQDWLWLLEEVTKLRLDAVVFTIPQLKWNDKDEWWAVTQEFISSTTPKKIAATIYARR